MNTASRLGIFGLTLVAVGVTAAGVGRAIGPVGPVAASDQHSSHQTQGEKPSDHQAAGHEAAGHGAAGHESTGDMATGLDVTGLSVSTGGYTLALGRTELPVGRETALTFQVRTRNGEPLRDYTETHDKDLHLIVVRRDTEHFAHVHPTRDGAGTWSVPLKLPAAGVYKVFADFAPGGSEDALTLVADLHAAGSYVPRPLPPVATTVTGGDYTVDLDGELVAGKPSAVTLTVSRNGRPVTDLQPYLAAYGHLVALRAGDLAYLHVHPEDELSDPDTRAGPAIRFVVDVPTAGLYRLFLDFQHAGAVRTAPLTVAAQEAS